MRGQTWDENDYEKPKDETEGLFYKWAQVAAEEAKRQMDADSNLEEILELIVAGLQTDGAHHKQWYLERILEAVAPDYYRQHKYQWQEGKAP